MIITKELIKLEVLPEHNGFENVVRNVHWKMIITDPYHTDISSIGTVETMLDIDEIDSFIDITTLTKTQILDWALEKQGGDTFIDTVMPIHQDNIFRQKQLIGVVEYDINNLGE